MTSRGVPKPEPENVLVARWRDRVHLVKTPEEALRFVHYVQLCEPAIDIVLRPEFGRLCTGSRSAFGSSRCRGLEVLARTRRARSSVAFTLRWLTR
jgi:hypothetical protein